MFSQPERDYLKTQRLARVATASKTGTPEVSPVAFEFDGEFFWIGTYNQNEFPKTRRYRNITSGNSRVSIVVDDLASLDPVRPRGIKVRGTAEVMKHDGMFGSGTYIRITPKLSMSWGIEPVGRDTQWSPSVKRWQ